MRDAFGGAFMIKIFLVFIFIYICFTAIALNYAKAFKVKNTVIEYLESNEIVDLSKSDNANKMQEFFDKEILGNMNYNISENQICKESNSKDYYCYLGVEIKKSGSAKNTEGIYYTVSTYFGWNAGFLKSITSLNGNNKEVETPVGMWKISGETRLIVNE